VSADLGVRPVRPVRRSRRATRVPTVLQLEAVECGAASLAMVLAHFGKIVPLEELRVACGVSRDGSNAANLVKAARTYGLVPHAYRRQAAELADLDLPLVVFWEFRHFLVVESLDEDRARLNDPATGPRTVTAEEFARSYSGIAISFERGPDFRPGGRRPSVLAGLHHRMGHSGPDLVFTVVAGLALVLPGLAVPVITKTFVDEYLVAHRAGWLPYIVAGLVVSLALQLTFSILQSQVLGRLRTKLALSMSTDTVHHLLRLPLSYFTQRSSGDLAYRVSLNDQVAQLLGGQLSSAALSLITVVFYLALMVSYDALLTAVVVVVALVNVVLLRSMARRRRDLNQRQLREAGELSSTAASGIALIESLKASGGENELFERWAAEQATLVEVRQDLDAANAWLGATPALLSSLATAAVLGAGALRVMDGDLTLGTLVAFLTLMVGFLTPVGVLVSTAGTLQQIEGALNRLDDVMRAPTDDTARIPRGVDEVRVDVRAREQEPAAPVPPSVLTGRLELREVTFGYNPVRPPLITGLSLQIQPGQRIALVGSSGSGKSTVSRLVTGLYRPWSGDVLLDGTPRDQVPAAVLAAGLALVDQDIMLFEGTVRENLTLWDRDISDEALVRATSDAAIFTEVLARPGGFQSRIEEGGRNFSGGQRQRLEIARSLVRDPALLVLDEASSALDPLTEQAIDIALRRRGCSCVVVAHRLSTVRDCDEILVLRQGQVVERGTHDELRRENGEYARLIHA